MALSGSYKGGKQSNKHNTKIGHEQLQVRLVAHGLLSQGGSCP